MILVTGATGFVGRAVTARLGSTPMARVRGALRAPARPLVSGVEPLIVDDLSPTADWTAALRGVDVVVHTAARVHVMHDDASDPLAEFRRVNVGGTTQLARQAAAAGVRRFIFISSIKVNGEETRPGLAYTADDAPAPVDPYGTSKHEAEEALRELSRRTGMEVVIIRPVLVYGPGVKGNFRSVVRWVDRGVPLPLGAVDNRRSLVAIDNLVDLIATCTKHPAAANQSFLVSDGEDLSTTDLLRRTAAALGKPSRLVPVPVRVLQAAARVLGKQSVAQRLFGSLQVDIAKTRQLLSWTPPIAVDEGLRRAVILH
jgi:nucleoside-diphosphate-sugar epimerase